MTPKLDRDTSGNVVGSAAKHWIPGVLRALVFLLVLPLATSGALPAWALLLGVEDVHVCHCAADHQDCVCPKCHPDQPDDFVLSSETVKGRCGDDEVAFGAKSLSAVLPPSSVLISPTARLAFVAPIERRPRSERPRPPVPPPRFSSSAA